MTKRTKLLLALAGTVVLFTVLPGCSAADKNARDLARETLAHVTEYEDGVRGMSRSLAELYDRDLEVMREAVTEARSVQAGSESLRLAEDLADDTAEHGFQARAFRQFIQDAVRSDREIALKAGASVAELAREKKQRLDVLEVQEKQFKSVRTKLERLQAPPTLGDEVSRFRPLFDEARRLLDEQAKRQPKKAAAGANSQGT